MNSKINHLTEHLDDATNGNEQLDEMKESRTNRRRKRNVSEWNREERKRQRIAGKEYVNTMGELICPRQIGADCNCRRKCYAKMNGKERERLCDNYYSLPSHDEQNAYLFRLIRKHEIARWQSEGSEKRTCTFNYFVHLKNGKEIHVCQQGFCHIHAISAHKVRLLCEKLDRNVPYSRDERGRHSNRPTCVPENISTIKKHFLVMVQSDRLCDFIKDDKQAKNQTGADLSITKMWRDFLNEHENVTSNDKGDGKIVIEDEWSGASVKLWLYNKVFHSIVFKEMSDVLSKRINDIKRPKSDSKLQSASASKGAVSLVQSVVPAGRTDLDTS